jgi:hypothetical protein
MSHRAFFKSLMLRAKNSPERASPRPVPALRMLRRALPGHNTPDI